MTRNPYQAPTPPPRDRQSTVPTAFTAPPTMAPPTAAPPTTATPPDQPTPTAPVPVTPEPAQVTAAASVQVTEPTANAATAPTASPATTAATSPVAAPAAAGVDASVGGGGPVPEDKASGSMADHAVVAGRGAGGSTPYAAAGTARSATSAAAVAAPRSSAVQGRLVWRGVGLGLAGHALTMLLGLLVAMMSGGPALFSPDPSEDNVAAFVATGVTAQFVLAIAALVVSISRIVRRDGGVGAGILIGWIIGIPLSLITGLVLSVMLTGV